MSEKQSSRLVAAADQELAAGDVSAALDTLRMAAASIPWGWNKGDAALVAALISGIRKRADGILRNDPSRAAEVRAIENLLVSREGGAAARAEPSTHRAAEVLAGLAYILSGLSLITAIVIGIKASKYTDYDGTRLHAGVLFVWIVIGISLAALWVAISLGLDLLLDIARTVRRQSSNS